MDEAPSNSKLKWQCRRGMLELDLILSRFLSRQLDHLTVTERQRFERLLQSDDPDLYAWLMGYEIPKDTEVLSIVELIRVHGRP